MADQEIFSLDPLEDEPKASAPGQTALDQSASGETGLTDLFSLDPADEPARIDGPPALPPADTALADQALFSLDPLDGEPKAPAPGQTAPDQSGSGETGLTDLFSLDPADEPARIDGPPALPPADTALADQVLFSLDPVEDEPKASVPGQTALDQSGSGETGLTDLFSLDPADEPARIDGPPALPLADAALAEQAAFSLDAIEEFVIPPPDTGVPAEVVQDSVTRPDADSFSLEPLDEPTATSIAPQTDNPAEPQTLVRQGIRISSLRLLFDFASTSQLSELVPITPLPAMPHGLRGLVSLHGKVLPVFDLASILGISRTQTLKEMLLVVGHGDTAAAIMIDGLPDRFRLSNDDQAEYSAPPAWLADCVLSAYAAGGETWLDIDHHGLLDRLEASLSSPRT
ncbi:MAG: chemotaxis protein CheW [Betaproteobacteria bacterium]|nr:chemotaxis protein CheW [Betaproteobacteria bacterium]